MGRAVTGRGLLESACLPPCGHRSSGVRKFTRSKDLPATGRRTAATASVDSQFLCRDWRKRCDFRINPILSAIAPGTRDQDLVRQSILGSREAFGLLVVRYSRSVRAVCLARTGRRDDLDDLVQEAFLRAFRGLSRLEDPQRFPAFLHRIAHNICVDTIRRSGREPVATADVDFATPSEPDQIADIREERLERMRRQVGRLPLALREAVLMFYFEQKPMAEIAAMLGITEGAVSQRLHRARQQLKQALGEDFSGDDETADETAPDRSRGGLG